MKVTIKIDNEESFQITVPDNSTVEDLKIASMVALPPQKLADASPTKIKLWYSGKPLEFSKTLASYGIHKDSKSTVYLTLSVESESSVSLAADNITTATTSGTTPRDPSSASPSPNEIQQSASSTTPHQPEQKTQSQQPTNLHPTTHSQHKKRTKSKSKTKCSFDNS
ncbi:unnamed protein product [Ambrosiozyma monospora]|uniref:Unnamed protein product n=1 Tax=Ambrosiozyma monospora TaxID=43982 RepID=A0A9W6Z167_AMBMO|nr:unnamed protein product [Ambrosiozyma monospora]